MHRFPSGTRSARSAPLLVVSARSCAAAHTGEYPDRLGLLLVQCQWSWHVALCVFITNKKKQCHQLNSKKHGMTENASNESELLEGKHEACSIHCRNLNSLKASCKLGLCPAQEVSNEVGLAAHMDVAFMGAAAESLIQCSAVPLLFAAVQLPDKDVVRPQHFILAVSAKPADKKVPYYTVNGVLSKTQRKRL